MEDNNISSIITLRLLVGYLGEKSQYNWWPCEFYSASSKSFLNPIFSKTSFTAQYNGLKEAASIIHDEYIGIGNIYHLFRLPEGIEYKIARIINDPEACKPFEELIKSENNAKSVLKDMGNSEEAKREGPFKVCNINELMRGKILGAIAGLYYHAFENEIKVYPYFTSYE